MKKELFAKYRRAGITVFAEVNRLYSGKLKYLLWNTTSGLDGLIYILVYPSTSITQTPTLLICDASTILYTGTITLAGTYGNYGAVYDGHIGIFTCSSNYGFYCYTFIYDKDSNTVTPERQIYTARNWYWSNAYAYKKNNDYYIVGTFNNSYRGPTTVNMSTGQYWANEFSPRNDMMFFYDNYNDPSNTFLALSGARRSDNTQNYYLKKLPNTYNIGNSSGAAVSNGLSNSALVSPYPVQFYDSYDKFMIIGTYNSSVRLLPLSDDYTQLSVGSVQLPSGFHIQRMILLTNGTGWYCSPSPDFIFTEFDWTSYV